jgi:hypothetical protein
MTSVTVSSHHPPAGEPCFRRCIAVAPAPPKARATPSIVPKSPRRRLPQRQPLDRHPRSAADSPGQRLPLPKPRPRQIPVDGNRPHSPRGRWPSMAI